MIQTPHGHQRLLQGRDYQYHKTWQLCLRSLAMKKEVQDSRRVKTNTDTCQLCTLYGLFI